MTSLQKLCFLLLTSLPLSVSAASQTLQSNFSYVKLGPGVNDTGHGVFTLAYEDTTPIHALHGTLADGWATYENAITSSTINWAHPSLHLDGNVTNLTTIYSVGVTHAFITLGLLDENGFSFSLTLGFEPHSPAPDTVELSNLIGLLNQDTQPQYLLPAGCAIYYQCGYNLSLLDPLRPVPIPSTAWLFGSALVALVGTTKRMKQKGQILHRDPP